MPKTFISLGYSCGTAQSLKNKGLRTHAYPFDWMLTSIQFIIRTFETDHFDFVNVEKLYVDWPRQSVLAHIYSSDCTKDPITQADCVSVHDADNINAEIFKERAPQISEKYSRRFERLYNVINTEGDVYFIRIMTGKNEHPDIRFNHETEENILRLHTLLQNKKFKANIILCVVTNGKLSIENTQTLNTNTLKIFNNDNELFAYLQST